MVKRERREGKRVSERDRKNNDDRAIGRGRGEGERERLIEGGYEGCSGC